MRREHPSASEVWGERQFAHPAGVALRRGPTARRAPRPDGQAAQYQQGRALVALGRLRAPWRPVGALVDRTGRTVQPRGHGPERGRAVDRRRDFPCGRSAADHGGLEPRAANPDSRLVLSRGGGGGHPLATRRSDVGCTRDSRSRRLAGNPVGPVVAAMAGSTAPLFRARRGQSAPGGRVRSASLVCSPSPPREHRSGRGIAWCLPAPPRRRGRAARWWVGGGDETMEEILSACRSLPADVAVLRRAARAAEHLDRLRSEPTAQHALSLLRTLITIAPDPAAASSLKREALANLAGHLARAPFEAVLSLANVKSTMLPDGALPSDAVASWITAHGAMLSVADVAALFAAVAAGAAEDWWRRSVTSALSTCLAGTTQEWAAVALKWHAVPEAAEVLRDLLPGGAETEGAAPRCVGWSDASAFRLVPSSRARCAAAVAQPARRCRPGGARPDRGAAGAASVSRMSPWWGYGCSWTVSTVPHWSRRPSPIQMRTPFGSWVAGLPGIRSGCVSSTPRSTGGGCSGRPTWRAAERAGRPASAGSRAQRRCSMLRCAARRPAAWSICSRRTSRRARSNTPRALISGKRSPARIAMLCSRAWRRRSRRVAIVARRSRSRKRRWPTRCWPALGGGIPPPALIVSLLRWRVAVGEDEFLRWIGGRRPGEWTHWAAPLGELVHERQWRRAARQLLALGKRDAEMRPAAAASVSLLPEWLQSFFSLFFGADPRHAARDDRPLLNHVAEVGATLAPERLDDIWERAGGKRKHLRLDGAPDARWRDAVRLASQGGTSARCRRARQGVEVGLPAQPGCDRAR